MARAVPAADHPPEYPPSWPAWPLSLHSEHVLTIYTTYHTPDILVVALAIVIAVVICVAAAVVNTTQEEAYHPIALVPCPPRAGLEVYMCDLEFMIQDGGMSVYSTPVSVKACWWRPAIGSALLPCSSTAWTHTLLRDPCSKDAQAKRRRRAARERESAREREREREENLFQRRVFLGKILRVLRAALLQVTEGCRQVRSVLLLPHHAHLRGHGGSGVGGKEKFNDYLSLHHTHTHTLKIRDKASHGTSCCSDRASCRVVCCLAKMESFSLTLGSVGVSEGLEW